MIRLILSASLLAMFLVTDAWATTRYVGTGGNDANTCAQSETIGTPKLTFASAKSCMVAGDTMLMLASSTFNEAMNLTSLTGTSTAPYTIQVNSGTVTFNAQSLTTSCRTLITSSTSRWITVSAGSGSLVFNGSGCADDLIGNRIDGASNLTFTGVEIKSFKSSGVYITAATNITIQNANFHDQVSPTCVSGTRYYGIYVHDGTNIVIKRSVFEGNPGGGVQIYPGPLTNVTFTGNEVYGNGTCPTASVSGMVLATDANGGNISGVVIANNLFYNNGTPTSATGSGGGLRLYATGGRTLTNTLIYKNTIYNSQANGNAYGIRIEAGPTGTILQNNHVVENQTGQIYDGGTGTVQTTNRTTGSLTDCTVSTSDFTLKAGASCLNAGTAHASFGYNGSAPDQGAFESIPFTSCVVEDGDASTVRVNFQNNVAPPLLPAASPGTFTTRKAGAGNAVTASARTGDTRIDLTVTNAIVGGDAVDISWSSGNLTDSSLIGGTLNQGYKATLTNQACTNNVGAVSTFEWHQAAFRWFYPLGPMATAPQKPDDQTTDNVNVTVVKGGSVKLHVAITAAVANPPAEGFFLYYKKNGGSATALTNTFGADAIAYCGTSGSADIPAEGSLTTNRTDAAGTFVSLGQLVRTATGVPSVDMAVGEKIANEYLICWNDSATVGDTYDFEIHRQDGTAANIVLDQVPRATIKNYAGGYAELWHLLMLTMLPMLGRIESNTAKPPTNFSVGFPTIDTVTLACPSGTGLKTTGTGTKRTVTCLH